MKVIGRGPGALSKEYKIAAGGGDFGHYISGL
jgi:hypothetical protein